MNRHDERDRRPQRSADSRAVEDASRPRAWNGNASGYQTDVAERTRAPRPNARRRVHVGDRCETVEQAARRYRAVPALVRPSGATSSATRITLPPRTPRAERGRSRPAWSACVVAAAPHEIVAHGECALDAGGDLLGLSGARPNRRVAAGLVERSVGGATHGDPARHRLHDRDAETLEARRIDEDVGAAVEARELLVGDVAEADHPAAVTRVDEAPAMASAVGPEQRRWAATSMSTFFRGSFPPRARTDGRGRRAPSARLGSTPDRRPARAGRRDRAGARRRRP